MSYYTREQILKYLEENEITEVKHFRKQNGAMYLWFQRHKELIGELPLTKAKRATGELTYEICANVAKKYQHRSDLQKHDRGVYIKLLRIGKLDLACAHMVPKPVNHNTEYVKTKLTDKPAINRIDMTGKIYNSWYVLGPSKKQEHTGLYWTAQCVECFDVYDVAGSNIRNGLSKRCSNCGCKNGASTRTGIVKTKMTPKESAEHYLLKNIRRDGRKRGWNWELSKDEFLNLIYKKCSYCGRPPQQSSNPLANHGLLQKRAVEAIITWNGIDRIDSSKGYVQGNVATCCHTCNKMKSNLSLEEFHNHIKRLYKYLFSPAV